MKIYSYILMALVILVTSAPTLALAQYEKEGGDQETMMEIFSLTLYVTISAILGVVGYSIWRVYKIRRKTKKMLA
jgi:heme/copper-type cytochrome/quinol oxidase subunit 2